MTIDGYGEGGGAKMKAVLVHVAVCTYYVCTVTVCGRGFERGLAILHYCVCVFVSLSLDLLGSTDRLVGLVLRRTNPQPPSLDRSLGSVRGESEREEEEEQ